MGRRIFAISLVVSLLSRARITGTCGWDPGSIQDLVIDVERDWVWDFGENGVQLVCELETPRSY